MLFSSSKRALSSISVATCLPASAASISACDDRRVARRAVERLLDRQHVGIVGGLAHELHDRIERLVGMVQQQIAFADHREHIGRAAQAPRNRRRERRIVQRRLVDADQRPQRRRRRACRRSRSKSKSVSASASSSIARKSGGHAGSRHSSRTGSPKRRLRNSDSIARSRSSASSSCRSRSASRVTRNAYERDDRHAGEERLQVVRDQIFEQHEPALARPARLDRHEARQTRRDLHARDVVDVGPSAPARASRPRARARGSRCTGTDGRHRSPAA